MKKLISVFLTFCIFFMLESSAFAINDPLQLFIDDKTATIEDWYLDNGEPMVSIDEFCRVFNFNSTKKVEHYHSRAEFEEMWNGEREEMRSDAYQETYIQVDLEGSIINEKENRKDDFYIKLRPTHKFIPDFLESWGSSSFIQYTGYNGADSWGKNWRMSRSAIIKNDVVYAPILSLTQELKYTNQWNASNNTIYLTLNKEWTHSSNSFSSSHDEFEDMILYGVVPDDIMKQTVTDGNYYGLVPYDELEGNTNDDEYIYDTSDLGEDIVLPVWRLEEVIDADCTVKSIDTLLEEVPLEKLQTPTGTDLATLYAETAIMRAACKKVDGGDLTINAALLKIAESVAVEAQGRLEEKLESVGIPPAREISKTVTLTTDETSLDIRIDPDVLRTQVDKIRVETPTYALTFKLEDLQDDLTGVLQFRTEDTGAGFAPSRTTKKAGTKTVVKIDLPKPKMSNPVTVSMPKQTGETVHQAVVSTDGQATASKYNPASDLMDGKVNTSGSYTVKSNEKDFSDIANKSQEMQKAIRYLASKGIINGTTETAFSPDGSINRAEIATLIVKALGKLDPTAVLGFTDVPAGSWYAAAAASSQRQGYIQGFEDHTFRGPTVINKVQIISVSSRVLQKEMRYKASAAPASILTKYSDTVDAWAQSDVALATKENLVLYRKDGTFSGRSNMTRGNAAIIIYRLFQRLW